jgi:ribosomal protein S18 acetylase RimI-like enzyme
VSESALDLVDAGRGSNVRWSAHRVVDDDLRMRAQLPEGYRLVEAAPGADEYLGLRARAGLSPKTREQALAALPGSWAACHVVHEASGQTVGMGRVLGDGGWYFHVVDMAVLPDHQRRGLGDAILRSLLDRIRADAPRGAYVNLLADPPGRRLYARHGFAETAPTSVGMALRLGP